MTKVLLFLGLSLFLQMKARASSLQIEVASTTSTSNYFQKPNLAANRVDLPKKSGTAFRLGGLIDVKQDSAIYFLYAPLTLTYNTQNSSDFEFSGTNFLGNTNTEVSYKFNSYRLGYLWYFGSESFKYWIGPVGKIRDAKITVDQASSSEAFANSGFVPLLGLGLRWQPSDIFSLHVHLDGAYASQGSAYDGVLEFRARLSDSFATGLGYRLLGGGADNEKLKNFAQFDSLTASIIYDFGK